MRTETDRVVPKQSTRCAARRHCAFTLVELLVVVGIIAVLVAILLPALSRARLQAQRVVCATQIRELVAGAQMYANASKGYLPDFHAYNRASPPAVDDSWWAASGSTAATSGDMFPDFGTNTPKFGQGSGLGKLFVHKFIQDYRILTCPSLEKHIELNGRARPAYFFNPHWAVSLETGALTTRYKKISEVPKDRCLISEFFYNAETIAHIEPRQRKSAYFNLGYSDGHVVTIKGSDQAYDRAAAHGWETVRGADAIGILEFMEAGKPLDRQLSKADDEGQEDKAYYSFFPRVRY